MAKDSGKFDMPAEMWAFADKSVEQAKTAFDTFVTAAQQAATAAQSQAMNAHGGARELGQLAMRYAERNIAASFDFAQKLIRAKDAAEVAALHSDYVSGQVAALTEQAKEFSLQANKMGGSAAAP